MSPLIPGLWTVSVLTSLDKCLAAEDILLDFFFPKLLFTGNRNARHINQYPPCVVNQVLHVLANISRWQCVEECLRDLTLH